MIDRWQQKCQQSQRAHVPCSRSGCSACTAPRVAITHGRCCKLNLRHHFLVFVCGGEISRVVAIIGDFLGCVCQFGWRWWWWWWGGGAVVLCLVYVEKPTQGGGTSLCSGPSLLHLADCWLRAVGKKWQSDSWLYCLHSCSLSLSFARPGDSRSPSLLPFMLLLPLITLFMLDSRWWLD